MIDKDITIKKLEDLCREVARIEFSHDFEPFTIECAIKSRKEVEELINQVRHEKNED